MEPIRAISELACSWAWAPVLASAKRGDGHTVLVLPGFNTSDASMSIMRTYLQYLGYQSKAWELGYNHGYRMLGDKQHRLHGRLRHLTKSSGGKVSLVGWSLGGVMARQLAREYPEMVRQVITLGAPFAGDPRATSARRIYEFLTGEDLDDPEVQRVWAEHRITPAVPTTSIFTRTDGVIAWPNCLESERETVENIEVVGSHTGLPANPMALLAIADRLALPETGWSRYHPLQGENDDP